MNPCTWEGRGAICAVSLWRTNPIYAASDYISSPVYRMTARDARKSVAPKLIPSSHWTHQFYSRYIIGWRAGKNIPETETHFLQGSPPRGAKCNVSNYNCEWYYKDRTNQWPWNLFFMNKMVTKESKIKWSIKISDKIGPGDPKSCGRSTVASGGTGQRAPIWYPF